MRIVHAVCTDAFAGVERHVAMLAAAESDAGHEVSVVGGAPAMMAQVIDRPAVQLISASRIPDMAKALDRLRHADVLNVHMTDAEVAAALAVRTHHVPAVTTRHFAAHRGASSALAGFTAQQAARRLSAQIAVSRYVAERIEGPSHVIVSGVPIRPQSRVPARRRRPVILAAQRLESEKRTSDVLLTFARSGLFREGWTLEIAGEGIERPMLELRVQQLGLSEHVRFLGLRSDIWELMEHSAILLAPRTDEALGLSVLEAMSLGLPVVAAGAGGHLETVGSVAAELLYRPGDLGEAAAVLRDLALDEARRDHLAAELQAAQRARFSIVAQAQATEAVYRSVR